MTYKEQLASDRAAAKANGHTLTPFEEGVRTTMLPFVVTLKDCPYPKGSKARYDWEHGKMCPYAPREYCESRGKDYATCSPDQYAIEVKLGLEYGGKSAVVHNITTGEETNGNRIRKEAA